MKKSLSLFSIFILTFLGLVIPFITLTAFIPLNEEHYTLKQQNSTDKGINETDFINTMFLRSSFFENGSETNYFINPTLKTSKSLTYNDKWYLDFLKDSYSTGVSYDKPSDKFMDLYKNGDNYVKEYSINKFYDVDKKQFLRELTNFAYSFINKYDGNKQMLNKLKTNIKDLQSVNLIEDNGKLIDSSLNNTQKEFEKHNDKGYFIIGKRGNSSHGIGQSMFFKYDESAPRMTGVGLSSIKSIYRGDGVGEPTTPTINKDTGEIIDGNFENQIKVAVFLGQYLDVIIQENIRVQRGGNPNYESSIVGTERIIFDFEIVDESDRYTVMYFIKKAIYRMILTIDKNNNIIAGSLELTHTKTASNGMTNFVKETKLGFLFTFMKEKDNIFNFDANINSYLGNGNIKYYEKMKGQIDINKFLKAFLLMLWCQYFKIGVIL